jgi:integrase
MTTDDLKAAKPGDPPIWDDVVKGLHLVVNASGTKSFLYYYRPKARADQQRKPKVGTFGEITLGEARRRARALAERVARGEDPKGDWQDQRSELTVAELWAKVWESHYSGERFQSSGWGKEAKRLYQKQLEPAFGNAALSEVTAARVRNWHQGKAAKPYSANRALAVLSKMFRYAEEQEWRPQHTNPCLLVKNHPEQKRKRYASEAEIAQIAPILEREAEDFPAAVAFLYLQIFTGSRPKAIEEATWEQLTEFERGGETWGILTFHGKSSAKTGEDERVLIPPQAMRILKRLPRVEGETITGMKMPRRLWDKIRKEVGCEDLWCRDWRRTFATVGMSGGLGMDTIGELLNHRDTQTTKTYAKLMDGRKVEAAAQIAEKMEGLLSQKKPVA